MDIRAYIEDSKLIDILNDYTKSDKDNLNGSLGTSLKNKFNDLSAERMVIPVLGMQGVGKSTLINSILKKDILPHDVDETTCVPVEITYGEDQYAEVYFRKGNTKKITSTIDKLREYVDNNENHANKMGVSKVVLYDDLPLLKTGVTIVDLPGVGSLTHENAETTKKYIKNLCTAIFVIPTVPPIRGNEAIFIRSVWSQFPKAIFVQNRWNDESDGEVTEALEHNTMTLSNISKEINTPYDKEIIVVNVRKAIEGVLQHNNEKTDSSGLPSLLDSLDSFTATWQETMEISFQRKFYRIIQFVCDIIKKLQHELQISDEQIRQERKVDYDAYKEESRQINNKIRSIDDFLDDTESHVCTMAKEKSSECVSDIRKEINRLIDKGVVDGEHLSEAFMDYQEQYMLDVFNDMFIEFQKIKIELEEQINELADFSLNNIMSAEGVEFYKDSAFKFEKSFDVIGGIGGTIGGLALGSMASTALTSLLSIEAVTITNPVTLIPGLAAMAITTAIGLIGSAIGRAAHKGVTKSRASETKKEMSTIFSNLQSQIYDTITEEFKSFKRNISDALNKIKEERKAIEIGLKRRVDAAPDSASSESQKYSNDLSYLEKAIKEMEKDETL